MKLHTPNTRHLATIVAGAVLLGGIPSMEAQQSDTTAMLDDEPSDIQEVRPSVGQTSFLASAPFHAPVQTVDTMGVVVTAYSSTPDQTDSTPFITATGSRVRQGIVAANFLPFGTKIRFPELFGNQVFVVDDRMHPRKKQQVDIWFPTRWEAKQFGIRRTMIEIVES